MDRDLVLEEKKEDFISNLRDDILCHILSLVPLRCAVQTSVLSNRWRYLWRKAIEFQGTVEDIPRVITLLLEKISDSDRKIRLHFTQGSHILGTIKDHEELHLNFGNPLP